MNKKVDWLILGFGLLGLFALLLRGVLGIEAIGSVKLDLNYIAVGMIVMYTFLTGYKQWKGENKQLGLYMMFFSGLITAMALISTRWI